MYEDILINSNFWGWKIIDIMHGGLCLEGCGGEREGNGIVIEFAWKTIICEESIEDRFSGKKVKADESMCIVIVWWKE